MFEWDDAQEQDKASSLEAVVARSRAEPVDAQRAIEFAHADALRDLLAREGRRRGAPCGDAPDAPDAPLDAAA